MVEQTTCKMHFLNFGNTPHTINKTTIFFVRCNLWNDIQAGGFQGSAIFSTPMLSVSLAVSIIRRLDRVAAALCPGWFCFKSKAPKGYTYSTGCLWYSHSPVYVKKKDTVCLCIIHWSNSGVGQLSFYLMNPNDLSVYVYHKCPDSSFPTKMSSVTTVHLKKCKSLGSCWHSKVLCNATKWNLFKPFTSWILLVQTVKCSSCWTCSYSKGDSWNRLDTFV
jgi:hypothetical protein